MMMCIDLRRRLRKSQGGWKDILLRVYQGISDNRILLVAAGVTFYSLLAISRASQL
jgi:uncharacterized BrkB/YihY/UPF0761 family membrane protein